MKRFNIILLCFIGLMIIGCKPDDLRNMASKSFSIEYNGEQCLPLESIVPSNEEISVSISNTSDHDFTWYVVIFPINEKHDLKDKDNTFFSASVPAKKIMEFTFTSPVLTARYDTLCVADDASDKRILKYLLVVNPYPTETILTK
ncbi:MAG: hypothetical protein ACYDH1_08410 [Anaerolineaceae bacterium]|jgi:hypothetical protein|nr:MAG: hypothetical protein CVU46_02385 [Chloroflexi bacterium HGW-Chloroflexi-8]